MPQEKQMRLDNNTFKRLYENAHDVQSGVSEQKQLQKQYEAELYGLAEEYAEKFELISSKYGVELSEAMGGGGQETPPVDDPLIPINVPISVLDDYFELMKFYRRPIGKKRGAPGTEGAFTMGGVTLTPGGEPVSIPDFGSGEEEMYGSEEEGGEVGSVPKMIPISLLNKYHDMLAGKRRPIGKKRPAPGTEGAFTMMGQTVTPGGGLGEPFTP